MSYDVYMHACMVLYHIYIHVCVCMWVGSIRFVCVRGMYYLCMHVYIYVCVCGHVLCLHTHASMFQKTPIYDALRPVHVIQSMRKYHLLVEPICVTDVCKLCLQVRIFHIYVHMHIIACIRI
jgi:hypothetical protein